MSAGSCDAAAPNADVTGIYCELETGHGGPHLAMLPYEWEEPAA